MKLIKQLTLLFFLLCILDGCSSTVTDPAVIYKNQSAEQLYRGAEINLAKRKYSVAIKQLEALDALYPFGPNAEQADLDLIYAYYQDDDMPSTAATAERFTQLYPRSEHVDYAYYMKGLADFYQDRSWFQLYFPTDLSQRDPGASRLAFDDFSRLLQLFPHSQYAPDARQRMVYLRNIFAGYELNVAQYYFKRGAYVAAANRANYIVQHFNSTPQVETALGIMVKSYRALGLDDLANQSLQILTMNYPNGTVLKDLTKSK